MIEYKKVLESLGESDLLIKCAVGELPCPLEGFEAPPYWYGFPPALIPIWSYSSRPAYLGYWKHWFIDRNSSYVQMYVASGRITFEIARTAEQFFCFLAMSCIVEKDGIDADVIDFVKNVGLTNLEQLNQVSLESGDNPVGFLKLNQFLDKIPLNCLNNFSNYDGEFPIPTQSADSFNKNSEFEINSDILRDWPNEIECPPWIKNKNVSKLSVFRHYLEKNDLGHAWLTLNSRGWIISDARIAIVELAELAKDKKFDILTSAWLSVANENVGAY